MLLSYDRMDGGTYCQRRLREKKEFLAFSVRLYKPELDLLLKIIKVQYPGVDFRFEEKTLLILSPKDMTLTVEDLNWMRNQAKEIYDLRPGSN